MTRKAGGPADLRCGSTYRSTILGFIFKEVGAIVQSAKFLAMATPYPSVYTCEALFNVTLVYGDDGCCVTDYENPLTFCMATRWERG